MNNNELAQAIAAKLVDETWILDVSYGCPVFESIADVAEALEKILNNVLPESSIVPKPTEAKSNE